VRISTIAQTLDQQSVALEAAGVTKTISATIARPARVVELTVAGVDTGTGKAGTTKLVDVARWRVNEHESGLEHHSTRHD
jgi:hypothetical protein